MNDDMVLLIISIVAASMRMAVPIGFAAIGGAISEKSGIVALGLEGYMIVGAFFSVVGASMFQSASIGLLFAMLAGGIFAGIYALMCIRFGANQTVGGLGMNIIAPGLVAILMVVLYGNKGKSVVVPRLGEVTLPIIKDIPILGKLFSGHTILFYLLILVAILSWIVFYKTPTGIRLRANGTNPEVINALGLSSDRIQYVAVVISGILAGMGGAYLTIGQLGFYSLDMIAGRGFIAIAVFVFARWNPAGCFWAALLFGFTQAIQMRLQTLGLPSQLIRMIPYIATLLVLINIRQSKTKNKTIKKPRKHLAQKI